MEEGAFALGDKTLLADEGGLAAVGINADHMTLVAVYTVWTVLYRFAHYNFSIYASHIPTYICSRFIPHISAELALEDKLIYPTQSLDYSKDSYIVFIGILNEPREQGRSQNTEKLVNAE
jgi:hypothetical protein